MGLSILILVVLLVNAETNAFNIKTNQVSKLAHNTSRLASQYFGQKIHFHSDHSLLVSVPYDTHGSNDVKSASGGLSSCPIRFNVEQHSQCDDVTPTSPNLSARDGFGLDFEVDPRGNVTACAPLRSQTCRGNVLKLGYCYTGTGHGTVWSPLSIVEGFNSDCPHDQVDLLFVLDGSTSINEADPNNFNTVKNWVKNITKRFDITSSGSAAVGLIQYSTYLPNFSIDKIVTEFEIGRYKSFSQFSVAMDQIKLRLGATFTAAALSKATTVFKNSSRFNDPLTKKVLVLLTDGQSNDREGLNASATQVRNLNITTIAVGVKADVLQELQIIANGVIGNNDRVYQLRDFSNLDSIVQSIFQEIEKVSLEGSSSSTFSAGNGLRFSETGFSKSYDKVYISISIYF
nr:integrin alpha-D-like [Ciona intestinalis]XP_026694491.1 integrin alpha-D-like [Ciona intestinalis]|eukprot:XP_018671345.1 integrin alpha-D-like [Ciona intestinalis]